MEKGTNKIILLLVYSIYGLKTSYLDLSICITIRLVVVVVVTVGNCVTLHPLVTTVLSSLGFYLGHLGNISKFHLKPLIYTIGFGGPCTRLSSTCLKVQSCIAWSMICIILGRSRDLCIWNFSAFHAEWLRTC